jgi:uncharacterized membrane protein
MNDTNDPTMVPNEDPSMQKSPKTMHERESRLRSLLKGISWRIVGTIDTMIISWIVTGNIVFAATIGSVEVITKVILYYFHERAWQMIPRGRVRQLWKFFGR